MSPVSPRPRRQSVFASAPPAAGRIIDQDEVSLLELIDHVLNQGVVLSGDVMLSVANVDLVYLRLAALACSADRILPKGQARTVAGAKRRRHR